MTPEQREVIQLQVYTLVNSIPKGQVTSYGSIARSIDGATARMVGRIMGNLPRGGKLPWYRVVNASLKISDHGNAELQREKLTSEGVRFNANGRIDRGCFWQPGQPDEKSG